jgi:hypothetical protein
MRREEAVEACDDDVVEIGKHARRLRAVGRRRHAMHAYE